MATQRIRSGAIVQVPLGDGTYVFGRLLTRPYIAFYDSRSPDGLGDVRELMTKPVLFTICVSDYAITQNVWIVVNSSRFSADDTVIPLQFLQDKLDPTKCRTIDAAGATKNVSIADCIGLERSSVWDPKHVEERLRDHYAGVPNKWLEAQKLQQI